MDITVTSEKTEDGKVSVEVTVAAADVDATVKQTYRDIAQRYNFQGFRRGRAPRPVIDGLVGREAVLGQATEDLINEVQPRMIEELDLVPVERPDWGDADLVAEGQDYKATCTVEVPPAAELKSYDAPEIEMPPATATDAEIDAQIDQLLSYRTTIEVDPDATEVKAGDMVQAKVEDKEGTSGYEGESRTIGLANPSVPAELVTALVGAKVGETKEVSWTREAAEGDPEGGEKTTTVEVTVTGIQKTVTPELTDDFVKTGFGFDTVAELRDAVKEEIEADKEQSLPGLKEDRVVYAIGEQLDLEEIPEAYENQVFSELAEEFMGQLQRRGASLDMYLQMNGIKSDEFLADLHDQAAERARQSLALDALAKHLGLECTEEDLEREFANAGVPDVATSMEQFKAEGRMPAVRQSIRRTKAVNWLTENAKVTEVDEVARRAEEDSATSDAQDADESAAEESAE